MCPAPLSEWPAWITLPDTFSPAPGPQGVAQALEWLEALAGRQGWPTRLQFALTLCADEALVNIATHAKPRVPGQALRLRLECGPTAHGVALLIQDDGAPFDPTVQELPALAASLDEAQPGGHGLRLMRHYLRQLLYRRDGEHNQLLLELPPPT